VSRAAWGGAVIPKEFVSQLTAKSRVMSQRANVTVLFAEVVVPTVSDAGVVVYAKMSQVPLRRPLAFVYVR
jgi:hypothetical protein